MGVERSADSEESAQSERPPPPVEQTNSGSRLEARQPAEIPQIQDGTDPSSASGTPRADSKAVAAGEKEPDGSEGEQSEATSAQGAYDGPFESQEAEFAARKASREYAASFSESSEQDTQASGSSTVQTFERPPSQYEAITETSQNALESSDFLAEGQALDTGRDSAADEQAQIGEAFDSEPPAVSAPAAVRQDLSESVDPPAEVAVVSADQRGWIPLPGEEHLPVTRLESRARAAELDAAGEQSDPWRQHVEQMRVKWDGHETRWPSDVPQEGDNPGNGPPGEGAASDGLGGSGDEPGSWRGDGDQYLNFEENYSVDRTFERVAGTEVGITDSVGRCEAQVDDAQLVGLEHRLKSEDRFKEKVAERLANELRRDPREAAETVADAVRYTYQIPTERYTQGCQELTDKLRAEGHDLVFSRNFWDDPEYKGINTRWRAPDGQLFEVQFHTPESFDTKQLTHGAYERLRNPLTSGLEVVELKAFQAEASSGIPIPEGVSDIPNYRRKGY